MSHVLVTAIYDINEYNNKGHSLEKLHTCVKEIRDIMKTESFKLIVYCNETIYSFLTTAENSHQQIIPILIPFNELWTYKYLEQIRSNRVKYHPTRDERTCPESHALVCTKFWFVTDAIDRGFVDNSGWIGWIDVPFSKSFHQYRPYMISKILEECAKNPNRNEKFNINILNAVDKKYKLESNKKEYYSQYRWLVCGNFFFTSIRIGKQILEQLKLNFIQTTNLGFGHSEEMLYLEILDDYFDHIYRSYGDYRDVLENFIEPRANISYIFCVILNHFIVLRQRREATDCLDKLLMSKSF